ncbi:outer membrane beta-barrel protein [Leeuwenhoekiella sp. NPDC079379]|uniref:outer membrane beta-barrel protein n=1 Tax=Leeuwenhoekiella sp. NPDC079379 TaxID=3364122 RepID=UPI0037CBC93E
MNKKSNNYCTTAALFFTLFCSMQLLSQKQGRFLDVSIGLGITAPMDESETGNEDFISTGFYAQGEYVMGLKTWFSLRPYAGIILTTDRNSSEYADAPNYEVTSNAFLLGGKARLVAPIPWVAPYVELGVGLSAGSFKTFTPFSSLDKKGVFVHIPVTLGLALGPQNNVDLEFTYYFHPALEQFSGAAAVGLTVPINW